MIKTCVFNSLHHCIRYFNFVVIRIYKLFLVDRDFSVHKYMKRMKNDSWMCSCILSSWENGIPLNKLFTLGERLFNTSKEKHVLKRAESHHCEIKTLGIFACNFSMFLKVSQRYSF